MKPCEIASVIGFLALLMSLSALFLVGIIAMKEQK